MPLALPFDAIKPLPAGALLACILIGCDQHVGISPT